MKALIFVALIISFAVPAISEVSFSETQFRIMYLDQRGQSREVHVMGIDIKDGVVVFRNKTQETVIVPVHRILGIDQQPEPYHANPNPIFPAIDTRYWK